MILHYNVVAFVPFFQLFHVLILKIVEVIYNMVLLYIILFMWLNLS
jgi:hypothetical protein